MSQSLLTDLFQAYYDCRKNKRNTKEALRFEMDYETNIIQLYQDIVKRNYVISPSTAFIVKEPVMREVFAGAFRDRVVHHFVINKLNPFFERQFIYDSYSCRVGKGTLFGIKQAKSYMRAGSKNYTQDCFILKLDIQAFFMNIDKQILFSKLTSFIERHFYSNDEEKSILLYLIEKIIGNTPQNGCIIQGKREDWNGLPKSKSLFYSSTGVGLPIGNLTSQIFANFYLHEFDNWIKRTLKIKYYGRYVDDFFLIHSDKEYLKSLIPQIKIFLYERLGLQLHPKKIYLQNYELGFLFLGAYIKPYRVYIRDRTKGSLHKVLYNPPFQEEKTQTEIISFRQITNSYLGMMKHFDTYNLRKKCVLKIGEGIFGKHIFLHKNFEKVSIKYLKTSSEN